MKKTCLILIIFLLFIGNSFNTELIAKSTKAKNSKSKIVKKTSKKSKSISSKKARSKKSIAKKSKKSNEKLPFTKIVLVDSSVADGVQYINMLMGKGRNKHSVHILAADLTNENVGLTVLKANNNATDLMKLQDMIRNYDSSSINKVVGAINANFWKAYSNHPIGTTLIDGEVVELNPYKEWTSFFVDSKGNPYIDNFKTTAIISNKNSELQVKNINRRKDTNGIVIYNKFAGNLVPVLHKSSLEKLREKAAIEMLDMLNDSVYNDSTEYFDYQDFEQKMIEEERTNNIEHSLYKASAIYLDKPTVNKPVRIKIIGLDTGVVQIPENGFIISYGRDIPYDFFPNVGSIYNFHVKTNLHQNVEFQYSVCGTPRLVRNGVAKHEATNEGSRGRRFISKQLPRTAIGLNKDNSQIYLVTVEPNYNGSRAANLQEMANIMKQVGCWNAMNLDGGGSTKMVVDNKNVMTKGRPDSGRKVSVGFGIIQKNVLNAEDKSKK